MDRAHTGANQLRSLPALPAQTAESRPSPQRWRKKRPRSSRQQATTLASGARQSFSQRDQPAAAQRQQQQRAASNTEPASTGIELTPGAVPIIAHVEGTCLYVDNADALSHAAAQFAKLARSGTKGVRALAVSFRRQKCRGVPRAKLSYLQTYVKTRLEAGVNDNFALLRGETATFAAMPASMRRSRCAPVAATVVVQR